MLFLTRYQAELWSSLKGCMLMLVTLGGVERAVVVTLEK